jgi:hypothetical protein
VRTDPFQSPKQRLGRAKHHIRNLERRFKTFFKKHPYIRAVEIHSDGVSKVHKVKMRRKLPNDLTDITYEALEALRSALDQTAYTIATLCNHPKPNTVYFPMTDNPAEFENTVNGRCKGFPPEIISLFCSFKAYPGGNDLLVALNQTRRQGFHRLIVPVGSAVVHASSRGGWMVGGPDVRYPTYIPNLTWDSTKDEMIFGIVGPGGDFQYTFDFTFIVAFGEVEGLAGQSVVISLILMSREVERIISETERAARRIGLIV